MDAQQQSLDRLAERYRGQGYRVVVNPGPKALPPFAKKFKVELLAKRPDGNVLVSAKADMTDFERDTKLADYADAIGKQRGWRYDVTVFSPPSSPMRTMRPQPVEPSVEMIRKALADAERLFDERFESQAILTAWSAFESAMRRTLREMGREAGHGSPPVSMLNELTSSGEITHSELRDLEGMLDLRNIIAHGYRVPPIGRSELTLLADATRGLLAGPESDEKEAEEPEA